MELECRRYAFRSAINTEALTLTVVIVDGKVIEPVERVRSRTGAHGEDVYCLQQEDWSKAVVITFNISNSGKKSIDCVNIDSEICNMLLDVWTYTGSIKKTVNTLLKIMQVSKK